MKVKMSNPDSGVTSLRPDLYPSDRIWLELTALDEAAQLIDSNEPDHMYQVDVADMTQGERIILATSLGQWIGALGEGEGA